jgi:hypothetical protein
MEHITEVEIIPPNIHRHHSMLSEVNSKITKLLQKDGINKNNPNWDKELNEELNNIRGILSSILNSITTMEYTEMTQYLIRNQNQLQQEVAKLNLMVGKIQQPTITKSEEKQDESAQTDFQMFKKEIQKRKELITKQLDFILEQCRHSQDTAFSILDKIKKGLNHPIFGDKFELFDKLYELYNAVKRRASMYHIDENTSLAKKCMIEAEIIFDELNKYQQLYQEAWDKSIPSGIYQTPPNPPLFVYPNGSYLKGGKRKTRKNKSLHTI